MTHIYCKTSDNLKQVGKLLCKENTVHNNSEDSWVINESEDDCWVIEAKCNKSTAGIIYKVNNEVICVEVDDDCAPKIVEPLIKKYGFDNVKWLLTK